VSGSTLASETAAALCQSNLGTPETHHDYLVEGRQGPHWVKAIGAPVTPGAPTVPERYLPQCT
jgi:hypothetical protein